MMLMINDDDDDDDDKHVSNVSSIFFSLGNIAIFDLWKSLLEFTLFRSTKKDMKIFLFLFFFDLFQVDLSPYFQLIHKNFHGRPSVIGFVLSIWFSKPFSSNVFSYQAIVRQLACLRKF